GIRHALGHRALYRDSSCPRRLSQRARESYARQGIVPAYAGPTSEPGRAPVNLVRDIFREYDIRGITGTELTPDVARVVGRAFAALLQERGVNGSVAVGRDNRPSGDGLHDSLIAGLIESGIAVVDIGVVPTPVAYWAQHNLDVVAGIQITGSHNPPEYNGFKLGVDKASIYGAGIQRIFELASAGVFPEGKGSRRDEAVIDRYIDDV